jgi:hypothetical protein
MRHTPQGRRWDAVVAPTLLVGDRRIILADEWEIV